MERNLLMRFIVILIVLGTGARANGQADYTTLELPSASPSDISSTSEIISSPHYRNNINPRAMRHFSKNFSEVTDEKWYYTPELIVVMFTLNGVNYRVDYKKNGSLIETLRTYNEEKLPADVRRTVKESYGDYTILLVQEIEQTSHAMVYVIHLEGKTKLINLQVCNGIVYEWQKFDKAK